MVVCAATYLSICVCFDFFGISCVWVLGRLSYLSSIWGCYSVESEDSAGLSESRKKSKIKRRWSGNKPTWKAFKLACFYFIFVWSWIFFYFLWFSSIHKNQHSKFQFHQDRGPAWKLAKGALASSLKKYIYVIGRLGGPYREKLWPRLRPRAAFSSPRSQFFPIRTDPKAANNIFIFFFLP